MTIASRLSGGVVYYYNRFDGEAIKQHVEASLTMIDLIRHDRRFECTPSRRSTKFKTRFKVEELYCTKREKNQFKRLKKSLFFPMIIIIKRG